MTIFLPEFVSDQAVRLAFSSLGEVVAVFKGRHKFNTDVRNGKRHVKIFPAGEDPAILPRKITFHGRIQRDVLFAEKVVSCYRCKTRHMLGENCPVATPTTEDSNMSLVEQSGAAIGGAAPVQQESSFESQPSAESQQTPSPIEEEAEEGDSSAEGGSGSDSDSGSSSESDDESESELGSSTGPAAPLEDSPDLPSRENLSVIQGTRDDPGQGSQRPEAASSSKENQTKKKSTSASPEKSKEQRSRNSQPTKTLKSLLHFPLPEIFFRWYRERFSKDNIFRQTLADLGIKGDEKYIDSIVTILTIAADTLRETRSSAFDTKQYYEHLTRDYNFHFRNTPDSKKPSIYVFDNYLFDWALKVWPRALDIIHEYNRR